jgi:hypothetical protein
MQHGVSTAFQLINVPMGVWIDERGRVVRPAEPAWTVSRTDEFAGKTITMEGEPYLAALRDWVRNGDRSRFALSDEEFARRVKPRSAADMEADASFKLAVWFQAKGQQELADKYWRHAQELEPEDWNYYRQEWSLKFTPDDADKKWTEKFLKLEHPYYPRLEIAPQPAGSESKKR